MAGFQPRRGQREILAYAGGHMGVSAVPGSGKTATMAALAARLLAERGRPGCPLGEEGRILVVTYQNAAVETLRTRIRDELLARERTPAGYDVRTLHSLAYAIVQAYPGQAGTGPDFHVLDERAAGDLLDKAVRQWMAENEALWQNLAPGLQVPDRWEEEWRKIARAIGTAVIGAAKNLRVTAARLWDAASAAERIRLAGPEGEAPGERFFRVGAGLYRAYQEQVETIGGLDFDDMVRLAVDLLEHQPDLAHRLGERWPVVLEDEAQDSVPLQEELLGRLTTASGNWIRVGDPNQSITSTFTAADPQYLRCFLARPEVTAVEMSQSGRCSPRIADLANALVDWTCLRHPVPEVRGRAFRRQHIELTDPGDPQQNPAAEASGVAFRSYPAAEGERADVVDRSAAFARRHPDWTLAVLVPTNRVGYAVAEVLEARGAAFDERLQSSRAARSASDALAAILAFAGDPLRREHLEAVHRDTRPFWAAAPTPGGPAAAGAPEAVARRLRSCYRPEVLLYPWGEEELEAAVPPVGPLDGSDRVEIQQLAGWLRTWLEAAHLPVDELVMAVAQDLLAEADLARAQQAAAFLRGRAEHNPGWRLPELAEELRRAGGTRGPLGQESAPFEPVPGRISLTTMHRAKGLEWDLVYAMGVDGDWFPTSPDERFQGDCGYLGGDPAAMARAVVRQRFGRVAGSLEVSAAAATRQAHVEVVCERLRLLYVAVTRARRYLSLSWSQEVEAGTRTRRVPAAAALEALRAHYEARWGHAG
ncbi:MAG: ATP-dependent helicase [Gemmatimonadota bacterium]